MSLVKLPFVAGSFNGRSRSVDLQETINLYPEKEAPTSKEISAFIGTPGCQFFADTLGQSTPRGFYVTGNGRLFYVNYNQLFEVLSNALVLPCPQTLMSTTGYVDICDNGSQMLIVDGTNGYLYDLTLNTMSMIQTVVYPITEIMASLVKGNGGNLITDYQLNITINGITVSQFFITDKVSTLNAFALAIATQVPGVDSCTYDATKDLITIVPDFYVNINISALSVVKMGNFADVPIYALSTAGQVGTGIMDTKSLNDSIFPTKPTTCCFKDGMFIVNWGGTNQFSVSGLASDIPETVVAGSVIWPATLQFTKVSDSDPIIALKATPSYLWIFGNRTTELWYTTGQPATPFLRATESTIDSGALSPAGIVSSGNDLYWVGSNPEGTNVVWQASSYQPTRISHHAIEYQISQLPTTQDVTTYTYQQEGHFFIAFNFTAGFKTFVYDLTTGEWHRRAYYNQTLDVLENHIALFAQTFNQMTLVCDRRNGTIHKLNLDYFFDDKSATYAENIMRIRTMPHMSTANRYLFVYKIELDIQKGVGLEYLCGMSLAEFTLCGQFWANPEISLQWSKDGGYTWSTEHYQSMGQAGKFKQRLRWAFGLGKSRDWVFRFATTAPVKIVFLSVTADIMEEAS